MAITEPKVLLFDIETAGVNALKADLGFVVCFGWKWLNGKKADCITIDEKGLKKFDDSKLLKQASKLIEEADLVVAHYGCVFDRRFIQGRLLINGLPPIPQVKMRDTCFMARKIGNFSSNRLAHLCKILDLDNQKLTKNVGDKCVWPDSWFKVMQGNMKALKGMATYCKGDVEALEELYLRLRSFDHNHERLYREGCRVCGGKVQYRGFAIVGQLKYRRTQCTDCGHWGRETKCVKETK